MTPRRDEVGARVARLRVARGLTQRALAQPRYTPAYVSAVESGRRTPSADAVAHFAERLGVTPADLTTGRSPAEVVRLHLRLVEADCAGPADPAGAGAGYQEVISAAAPLDAPVLVARARLGLAGLALRRGDTGEAAAQVDRAEELLTEAAPHLRAEATAVRAVLVGRGGDLRYATYLLASARDGLVRDGYPDPAALLTLHAELAVCHLQLDDEPAAAEAAAGALALAVLAEPVRVAGLHLTVAASLLARARTAEAATAVEQARQAARQATLHVELASCHRARGRGRWAAGDVPGALADLTTAYDALRAAGQPGLAGEAAVELAEAYRALGRPATADALVGEVLDREGEGPGAARAARVRGLLRADAGDGPGAERYLRAAVEGFRAAGRRRELAGTVLALADHLARAGRPAEALDLMREGLREVERLGERPPSAVRPAT
ncbi:Helix-turn-helix domain protein [Micromonospora sp. MW-13]|uniref:helix-turn-helix domain-containing protein n=1 Tax=Micromonospora sp. MW-13 TaxID=2094022 RepID=UPI000ED0A957|nr:helix-turn-helix transcriptional regulator [Micromonospora sp. MW-13]RGC67117.1 Helix-turn-helix domain protein [Micromonospora sp. MW-13]